MSVVVVGSCNIDLVSYVPRLPKPGETLHGSKFVKNFGGKGANQCIVAARLGASAAMVAKLGRDSFGDDYLENLKKNNVNIDHVTRCSDAATGVASIAVEKSGQNSIMIVSGANLELSRDDVNNAQKCMTSARVMVCQLEISLETTLHALRVAKENGVTTIFNPAPAQESLPDEIYKVTDVFCPNETEAALLCGQPVESIDQAKAAIDVFLSRGVNIAIITLGEQGAIMANCKTPKKYIHAPAQRVKVVDSTGAGDSFVGSLAYFMSLKDNHEARLECVGSCLEKCVQLASISVQRAGTQPSYPYSKDLDKTLLEL